MQNYLEQVKLDLTLVKANQYPGYSLGFNSLAVNEIYKYTYSKLWGVESPQNSVAGKRKKQLALKKV